MALFLLVTACELEPSITGNTVTIVDSSCTDSDGGVNSNDFGYVRGRDSSGRFFDISDTCGINMLAEQYCENNAPKSKVIKCECAEGKCV